nr:tail protein X [Solimicrobium silvestre]
MTVRTQQYDTLDLVCWRHLGTTNGVVEAALELNRTIADPGAILPHGTLVTLPEPSAMTPTSHVVQLWD